jgi:hypothetical protein
MEGRIAEIMSESESFISFIPKSSESESLGENEEVILELSDY